MDFPATGRTDPGFPARDRASTPVAGIIGPGLFLDARDGPLSPFLQVALVRHRSPGPEQEPVPCKRQKGEDSRNRGGKIDG